MRQKTFFVILGHFLPFYLPPNDPKYQNLKNKMKKMLGDIIFFSLFHLMCAIASAHTSTRTTSLMPVKNSTHHLGLWHLLSGTMEQRKWKKEWKHDHFSLTFVTLLLAWMLYFHVWFQNKGKFLVQSEYYNQSGIY